MSFIDPEELIYDLPIEPEINAADFGCGAGWWTIPLARKIDKGIVYAVDLLEEPLSALRGKLERENISNVKVMRENIEEGVSIADNKVDLVLMTNFLFQVEKKEKLFSEARRILKKGGFILVTEWNPDSPIGPQNLKIEETEIRKMAVENDFALKDDFRAGMHHYGLLYQR